MNRRGELDQIVTSVVILFASFLISFLFIVISSGAGTIFGADSLVAPVSNDNDLIESRILAELFLSDSIDVPGKSVIVRDAFIEIASGSSDQTYATYLAAIEQLFNNRYSCGGQNSFVYSRIYEQSTGHGTTKEDEATFAQDYIRYTHRTTEKDLASAVIFDDSNKKGFYTKILSPSSAGGTAVLAVKEVVRCQ